MTSGSSDTTNLTRWRAVDTVLFYATVITGCCSLAWSAIGIAIALSVRSLRDDPSMPLWYLLPLTWGLSLTALLMLAGAVARLLEHLR